MKWKEIFDTGIKMGQDSDIRNIDIPGSYKKGYADCRIIYGNADNEVKKVYAAVDAGVQEMLVVNELNRQDGNIDGIIMHHPAGAAYYKLIDVVDIQKYNWIRNGVDPGKAEKIYNDMIGEEIISLRAGNHLFVENAAGLLDIPVMCMHTAVDNLIQIFFERFVNSKEYGRIAGLLDMIKSLPEFAMAASNGDEPYLVGNGNLKPGKIMVDMTGGMDPDSSIFYLLKKAGISTIIGMHYSQDNIKAIRKSGMNAIITGHMASDSLGFNIFCDRLEEMGVTIISGPGLYRYKRSTDAGQS